MTQIDNFRRWILFFLFFALSVNAQIPNADFEDWSGGEPVGWFTLNVPGFETITQSNVSQSGASALRGSVVVFSGLPFGPGAITGNIGNPNFPVSERYSRLTGYYQYTPFGNDELSIAVTLSKNDVAVGIGVVQIQTAAGSYTPFSVDINYFNQEVPDAASINIAIINTTLLTEGSTFLIDNLVFDNAVGIGDESENALQQHFVLAQNYPNPFNPTTTIRFSLPQSGDVQLSVYNSAGQEVSRIVDDARAAGSHSVTWDARQFSSGVYYYRLVSGKYTETKKLILLR